MTRAVRDRARLFEKLAPCMKPAVDKKFRGSPPRLYFNTADKCDRADGKCDCKAMRASYNPRRKTDRRGRDKLLRFEEEEIFAGGGDDGGAGVSDRRAFRREEMTACERCGRTSPPTRMKCLYCGAPLPAAEGGADLRRPTLKPLEEWERGFNVVLAPRGSVDVDLRGDATREAASLLRLKPEQLSEMIASRAVLPLARTGLREEVELLERRLGALGLTVEIISDEDLAIESEPPRRVRKIAFDDANVTGWSSAESESDRFAWDEIVLIVVGRIFKKRIEVEERLKRGAGGEVIESRELSDDVSVVDLYFTSARANWRVNASGFDYSCLGAHKSLLASENFSRLVEVLRERATRATFDDSYRRVRHWLQFAWSPTERTESGGVRRERPGRVSTEAVTSVTNESQFTRYGRLLRHFAARQNSEQR
jgi:hypothetical protein